MIKNYIALYRLHFIKFRNYFKYLNYKVVVTLFVLILPFSHGCSSQENVNKAINIDKNIKSNFKWVSRGEFKAVDMKKLYPPFTTEVVSLVEEGKEVKKGDVICTLAPQDRLEKLKMLEAEAQIKNVAYQGAEYCLKCFNDIEKNKLEIVKLNTQKCLLKLNQAKRLRDWKKIVELEASLKPYKLTQELLEKKLLAKKVMVKKGFSAKLEELRLEKDLYIAKLTLTFSKYLLSYLLKHVDEKRVVTALHEHKNAQADENAAEKLFRKNVDTVVIDFNIAEREKNDAHHKLDKSKAEIASLTVRADCEGTTLWGKAYDGTAWTKIYEGAKIWPGIHMVSLIKGNGRAIEFYMDQSEIGDVRVGDKVLFLPDAYPELRLIGEIYFLSPIALSLPNTGDGNICLLKIQAKIDYYPSEIQLGNSGTVMPFSKLSEPCSQNEKSHIVGYVKMKREVSTSGDIKPFEAANILPPYGGKLMSIGEEGAEIKKNDVIAGMKSDEMDQKLTDAILALQKKEEELALLKKKNELENKKLNKLSEVKLGALKVSELEHAALIKSRDDDKIIKFQKDIELINEKITLSKEKLLHTKELFKKGLRSSLEVLEAELEIVNHIKTQIVTTNDLRLEESGPTKTQIEISKIDVAQAKLEYLKACQEKELQLYSNNIKYQQLELEIRKQTEKKGVLQRYVDASLIKSPIDGVIVLPEIHKSGGKKGKVEVGESLMGIIPFMRVAKMNSLQISTKISEMDAKFLKPGQEVCVALDAHPGKDFRGWIKEVGILATTDFEKRQDAVINVIISLKSDKHLVKNIPSEFKPGATCEVKFKLYDVDKALVVPFDYCSSNASGSYVITKKGERKFVDVLFSDGLNGFVIESGLSEGDEIIELRGRM